MSYINNNSFIAVSNLGFTWQETLNSLEAGKTNFNYPKEEFGFNDWPIGPPVGLIQHWGNHQTPLYFDRTITLLRILCERIKQTIFNEIPRENYDRISFVIATSHGDPGPVSAAIDMSFIAETAKLQRRIYNDDFSDVVYETFGFNFETSVISAACASAIVAVNFGNNKIQNDYCDQVIIIALDTLSIVAYTGFNKVGAMSPDGTKPFDINRNGMTASEGGVAFLLERDKPNKYSENIKVVNVGLYCDNSNMVEPSTQGIINSLNNCLKGTEIKSKEISFVYWHGTGTALNDKSEGEAAKIFFDGKVPCGASTKGSLGHTMGASSGFNILAACHTILTGKLLPTARLNNLAFDFMNLSNQLRTIPTEIGLCVALGFGGINTSLVIKKEYE